MPRGAERRVRCQAEPPSPPGPLSALGRRGGWRVGPGGRGSRSGGGREEGALKMEEVATEEGELVCLLASQPGTENSLFAIVLAEGGGGGGGGRRGCACVCGFSGVGKLGRLVWRSRSGRGVARCSVLCPECLLRWRECVKAERRRRAKCLCVSLSVGARANLVLEQLWRLLTLSFPPLSHARIHTPRLLTLTSSRQREI